MSRRGENKTAEMLQKVQEIESEFDEPLDSIIIVMRQQGCKWDTIAGVLDMSYTGLLKWRKRFGIAHPARDMKRYEEKRGSKSPIDSIAKNHGYKDFADLYRDMRLSKKMTVQEVADKIGVTPTTIRKWTPKPLKGIRHVTPKIIDAANANLVKAREHSRTPWREDMFLEKKRQNLSIDNLT